MKVRFYDIYDVIFASLIAFLLGFLLGFLYYHFSFTSLSSGASPISQRTGSNIIDKVKELQRLVGCEKIDANIGPETTRLVNSAVEREEKELFNQYAEVYMTPSGAPEIDDEMGGK